MGVNKLLHTRYRVDDLERTVQFYKDVLGLEEVGRHESSRGSRLVFLKAPGSDEQIEICCYPKSGPVKVQNDLTHLAFEVDDMEVFVEGLAGKGVQLSEKPSKSSSGSVIAFLDAPEGYEIELIQRPR
jgi:lactoylglutathione lyase